MPVGPAVADAEREIGGEHRRVSVAMTGLQPDHAGHEPMIVGNRAPAHQRRNHRHAGDLGELDEEIGSVGIDDAAAGDDERPLGVVQHRERLLDLRPRRLRLVDRQRLVGVDVELDLGHLHVERQVDQHRAGAARTHQVECLLKRARHLRRLAHRDRPLGDRLRDRFDVHRLEVFLVQPRARRLAGDAEDRNRVRLRRIESGDHVGAGRPGRADAHADVARHCPRVALGHVRRAFDVARQHVRDAAAPLHRGVQRIDRGARDAERAGDSFLFQHEDGGVDCGHAGHGSSDPEVDACEAVYCRYIGLIIAKAVRAAVAYRPGPSTTEPETMTVTAFLPPSAGTAARHRRPPSPTWRRCEMPRAAGNSVSFRTTI